MKARTRNWLLYAAAWIPFAVLLTVAIMSQEDTTLMEAAVSAVFVAGVAAVAGAFVWHLTGRLPVGMHPLVFFPVHCALAIGYGLFYTGTQLGWLLLVAGYDVASDVGGQAGLWILLMGTGTYVPIAGISYLIRTQRRLREREVAAARAEGLAAQAQLHAVRAQLNPHFLFNSLHSLSTLIRHDPAAAEDAVDRLGDLLRYALDHGGNEVVRLRDEVAFTRNYIALEKLRFDDRLCAEIDVDDDALDAIVPPFLLQPLVENAIRHGLAPNAGRGSLAVRASVHGSQLRLEVHDDGRGAPPAAIGYAAGLGLPTLRQQFETRFGTQAALDIESSPGSGFRANVTIPARMPELEPIS